MTTTTIPSGNGAATSGDFTILVGATASLYIFGGGSGRYLINYKGSDGSYNPVLTMGEGNSALTLTGAGTFNVTRVESQFASGMDIQQ